MHQTNKLCSWSFGNLVDKLILNLTCRTQTKFVDEIIFNISLDFKNKLPIETSGRHNINY